VRDNFSTLDTYVYDVNRSLPVILLDSTHKYVWGLGLLYSIENTFGSTSVYHYDGLGSVRALTDVPSSGEPDISDSENYDAFGNGGSSGGQPFKFAGEQLDQWNLSDTSHYYLRARYYDPSTSRFIVPRPVRGRRHEPAVAQQLQLCTKQSS
jgi:RHS repeat-associated protein